MLCPARLWIYRLFTSWLPETRCFGLKAALLRWCGAQIGTNVRINSSVHIMGDGHLVIGDNVWIGAGTHLAATGSATLTIEADASIGALSYIVTGSHLIDLEGPRAAGAGIHCDVTLGRGVWAAAHILVIPGVMTPHLKIGEKAILAAGAVLTGNVPPRTMMVGNPAKPKGTF